LKPHFVHVCDNLDFNTLRFGMLAAENIDPDPIWVIVRY